MIFVYQNSVAGTDAAPIFLTSSYVRANGSIYVSPDGDNTFPYPVDWDSDGKLDLLCGLHTGGVVFFRNTSTDSPTFESPVGLQAGGFGLDAGTDASPVAVDWNGDGKKDLLVGNSVGNVVYYENQGTNETPVLAWGVNLKVDGADIDIGSSACIDVADYNGDGQNDLIVGNSSGYVTVYLATVDSPPTVVGDQIVNIESTGHFFAFMFDFTSGSMVDQLDTTLSGSVGGSIALGKWYGTYIYDYDAAGYTEGFYMLGN